MISGAIHCFIATMYTVKFPETAIRAVLNNKLETREINNKEMSYSEISIFPLEIYQFYL